MQCRICLDEAGPDFIAPCKCKGSSKFVHRSCLDTWRATNNNPKAFIECNQCKFQYVIEVPQEDPQKERARMYQYFSYLVRDTLLFLLANELCILLFAGLTKFFDSNDTFMKLSFSDTTNNRILKFHIIGLIFYLATIGFVGMCYSCLSGNGSCSHGNCDCRCCRGRNNAKGGTLLCILAILVFVGIFVGVYIASKWFVRRANKHKQVLWKYIEAQKYMVRDFNGREDELLSNV
jgi:hypothetical protein